uniref:Ig-like domain-containing protein n=1 Tax=Strigops habroptila TaxID=2489341 RepID=A0A672UHV5_STRHB
MWWCCCHTWWFFQLLSLVCTSKGSEVIGTLGRSITFYLQRLEGEAAAWSFHNDVIVTVKFGDPPEATFFDDNYKPRLAFPNNGSALTISQLRMEDAGTYTAKSSGVKTTFTLHIYRELSVPTVTCMVQNCSASICRYILHCTTSGSSSGNVSYIWSMGSLRKHGATMLVEESLLDEPLLTCTVQNPVSSSNITIISLTALCAGNSHGKMHEWVVGKGHILRPVVPASPRAVLWCTEKHMHFPPSPFFLVGTTWLHLKSGGISSAAVAWYQSVPWTPTPPRTPTLHAWKRVTRSDPDDVPEAEAVLFPSFLLENFIPAHQMGNIPAHSSWEHSHGITKGRGI